MNKKLNNTSFRKLLFKDIEWPTRVVSDEMEIVEVKAKWRELLPDIQLAVIKPKKDGDPIFVKPAEDKYQFKSAANIEALFKTIGATPWLNIMKEETMFDGVPNVAPDTPPKLHMVLRAIRDELGPRAGIKYTMNELGSIVNEMAKLDERHPVEQWFLTDVPEWDDNKPDYIGQLAKTLVPKDDYPNKDKIREWVEMWLIQGVQAAMGWREPKQMRSVLTLGGGEMLGKSDWFRKLVPADMITKWVGDGHINPKNKDDVRAINRVWIYEVAEFDNMTDSDHRKCKGFLSSLYASVRLPWDKDLTDIPKTTNIAATANRDNPLRDPTGNSRYLFIALKEVNNEHGIDPRDIWSQAYALWKSGKQWWLDKEQFKFQAEQTAQYRRTTELEDAVADVLDHGIDREKANPGITTATIVQAGSLIRMINDWLRRDKKHHFKADDYEKQNVATIIRARYGEASNRSGTKGWVVFIDVEEWCPIMNDYNDQPLPKALPSYLAEANVRMAENALRRARNLPAGVTPLRPAE